MSQERTTPDHEPGNAATPPASPEPDPALREALNAAVATAHAELVRAGEGKSGLLLSWAGAAFGVLGTLLVTGPAHFPGIARFGVIAAILVLSMAVVLILFTIRPALPKHGGTGLIAYATAATAQDVLEQVRKELASSELSLAESAFQLSHLALTKHRHLRWAINLIVAAIGIITITLALQYLL